MEGVTAAVRNNWAALEFVNNQTEEICLAAVGEYGGALEWVKEQTEEICLAAVENDGLALEYVVNQTEKIYLKAIKQSREAIWFIDADTFKYNPKLIRYFFNIIEKIYLIISKGVTRTIISTVILIMYLLVELSLGISWQKLLKNLVMKIS